MEIEKLSFAYQDYQIAAYRCGSGGTPVMLLHGAGLDSAMLSWREVMPLLAEKGYTAYAFDYPGYGESSHPAGGAVADFYPAHLALIDAVRARFGLETMAVAGLSMGGAFAIGYALTYPQHTLALIATDPWGITAKMPCQGLTNWYVHNTHWTSASYRWMGRHPGIVRWSLAYGLFGDAAGVTPELVEAICKLCQAPDAGLSMEDFQKNSITATGTNPYYMQRLAALSMPVLFVNGECDPSVPLRDTAAAAKAVPGAELYVMKGCKHWPQKERPEEYAVAAADFLARRIAPAAPGGAQ